MSAIQIYQKPNLISGNRVNTRALEAIKASARFAWNCLRPMFKIKHTHARIHMKFPSTGHYRFKVNSRRPLFLYDKCIGMHCLIVANVTGHFVGYDDD